ncbi:MAG: ComEA family DNA-binding protein [Lachnospiraceae bacterium]|nr:ComEA family DNA-binding protein [Lachnospiraceae bacterium]
MDKMKKGRVVAVLAAVLLCGTAYFYSSYRQDSGSAPDSGMIVTESFLDGEKNESSTPAEASGSQTSGEGTETVYIHVCGEVKKPGVYTFDKEPRVIEAVQKAGGFTKEADRSSINQAESVPDGTQLRIEARGGPGKGGTGMNQTGTSAGSGNSGQTDSSGKININTASKEELMTINGIGEARAAEILSYRESNGAFQKIEDIMKISGIKTGIFDKIKEYIMV